MGDITSECGYLQCLESEVFHIKNANPGSMSYFIPCSTWCSSMITLLIVPYFP